MLGIPDDFLDNLQGTTDYLWDEASGEQRKKYNEISNSILRAAQNEPPSTSQPEKKTTIVQVPRNFKKTRILVDYEDDECSLSPERKKDFYQTGQVYQLGAIEIKLHYDPLIGSFFICWMKNNDFNPDLRNTHMKASVFEIDLLLPKVKALIEEIKSVRSKDTIIPFLQGDSLSVEHRNSELYWSPDLTLETPSRSLLIRPYRHENGSYKFILMNPKKLRAKTSGIKWLGASHTLCYGEMLAWVSVMEELCKKADELELEEIHNTSDKSQWTMSSMKDLGYNTGFDTVDRVPNAKEGFPTNY